MARQKRRAALLTLGCKTNQYESDALRRGLLDGGFDLAPFGQPADVVLVNTCTVTGEADRKSRQMIRRARTTYPQALVVALGCQVNAKGTPEEADLCLSNEQKPTAVSRILALLDQGPVGMESERTPPAWPDCLRSEQVNGALYPEFDAWAEQSETRAYLKIEDGCNRFCSYCIIPYVRGRVRSRQPARALAEARHLAERGFREVVLTGIHICSYGSDLGLGADALTQLTGQIAEIPGIERIRLGSLDPSALTPAFYALAAHQPKLCPHVHLSLQSGSDSVLRRMRRRYQTAEVRAVVRELRQAWPDPGLSCDLIAGFPGETEEEARQTEAFCREIGFSRLHVFRYSARQGTAALTMPDQVPPDVRAARADRLIAIGRELSSEFHRRQIGRTLQILVERGSDGWCSGYSETYLPMRLRSGTPIVPGQIIAAIGEHADADFVYARKADDTLS